MGAPAAARRAPDDDRDSRWGLEPRWEGGLARVLSETAPALARDQTSVVLENTTDCPDVTAAAYLGRNGGAVAISPMTQDAGARLDALVGRPQAARIRMVAGGRSHDVPDLRPGRAIAMPVRLHEAVGTPTLQGSSATASLRVTLAPTEAPRGVLEAAWLLETLERLRRQSALALPMSDGDLALLRDLEAGSFAGDGASIAVYASLDGVEESLRYEIWPNPYGTTCSSVYCDHCALGWGAHRDEARP